jgi:hypothetical protein
LFVPASQKRDVANNLTLRIAQDGPQHSSNKQVGTESVFGRIPRTGTSIVLSTLLILLLAPVVAHDNRRQRADYKKHSHGRKQLSAQRRADIKSPNDCTDSDENHDTEDSDIEDLTVFTNVVRSSSSVRSSFS